MGRTRVLFVSEAVTLAQVVRLAQLARHLPRDRYDVHFAAAHFDELVFADLDVRRWPIFSLPAALVDRRVRGGRRLYGLGTLRRYLADDLRVLDAVRPDVVVGDLRLSLAVAAPLRQVPYAALINAYWSLHARRDGFPLPEHPIVRLLGPERAARHFPRALPFVFRHFAAPVNRLRAQHGLPPIGSLLDVLTFGDRTLHPDPAALVPTAGAPASHLHLGAIPWAPRIRPPLWAQRLEPARPTVYVTLGSSGRVELLPRVVAGIVRLGAQVMVATAGRPVDLGLAGGADSRVHVAPFLPGDQAAMRADVVVSNGGSTTSYQALAAGKPVVGVAANLDQYLAMDAITRAGAGVLVRAGTATAEAIASAVGRALEDAAMRASAHALADVFAADDPFAAFIAAIDGLVAPGGAGQRSTAESADETTPQRMHL